MITRLLNYWERIRSSLWFLPTLMSVVAIVLAWAGNEFDRLLVDGAPVWVEPFLYKGDIEGARTVLATISGSMITVAGVTFSVTMVALSLASSQFGPRLLVNFMRDQSNQVVLGTFIATFLFGLVALGLVGVDKAVLPAASASIGLVLAVASVAVLIYFIHHAASTIRAEHVVDVVSREVAEMITNLFPDEDGASAESDGERTEIDFDEDAAAQVRAEVDGYVQAVDEAGLCTLAAEVDVVLRLHRRPGHFVFSGEPLVSVAPAERLDDELARRICSGVILGRLRTGEQDPEYGIMQLVEIAVRALSPGVNDPHTAVSCVDWLGSILYSVARRPLRRPVRTDDDGNTRLILHPVTFGGLVRTSFNQIRQFSYDTPAVAIRLLEVLGRVACAVEEAERAEALRDQADMVLAGAGEARLQKHDQQVIEQRHAAVVEALAAVAESSA